MSLNQILHDEQIAMMQHAAATAPADVLRHRREIARLAAKLSKLAYPHRPYVTPGKSGLRAAVARWEDDGGAL